MTSSITPSAARAAFATLLVTITFASTTTACGVFGSDDPSAAPAAETNMPTRDPDAGAPKGTAVGGPADPSELTDPFGVFVSPNGHPHTDGNHDRPALTIQDGIDLAKRVGKRVYVCAGTYHEQITLADSISIIGGLECSNNEWSVGKPGSRTRIEAPNSPAITATNITSATRLESLDVIAPDATKPSGSSIALIADHAAGLTIATSKLTAGNAANGADGTDAVQLANAANVNGVQGWDQVSCTSGSCYHDPIRPSFFARPPQGQRGENVCIGAAGFVGQPGGYGGSGGLYQIAQPPGSVVTRPVYYLENAAFAAESGDHTRSSAPGNDGTDGANAPSTLSISAAGFAAASGTAGSNGTPGYGGRGGDGYDTTTNDQHIGDVWTGWTGAGGGAGGCPGLAGGEGKGGGASIAAILIESPVTFDASELLSSRGGAGGLGSFGSAPTTGGTPGINTTPSLIPTRSGQPGGRGGASGVSGNGASGPSLGIAYVGAKPVVSADTKITPGASGPAIPARSRTTIGVTKTIPASPAGIAKDVLGL